MNPATNSLPHRHRRALERRGWRTLLDYHEDHIRDEDGQLVAVVPRWIAEAERFDGCLVVASVNDAGPDAVWRRLRRKASEVSRARHPATI